VVEQPTHNPKFKGSNPDAAGKYWDKKMVEKVSTKKKFD
jgi:hypothetical protein